MFKSEIVQASLCDPNGRHDKPPLPSYVWNWPDWSSSAHGRQHCWSSQANARQVRVSDDRQTNEKKTDNQKDNTIA